MIRADNLTKRYKKQVAVDDLSFSVETGKVTGFLGPNGAGKSTTMRLMLGLDQGKGTTTFDGKRLSDYEQPAKIVGILLEAKAFHPTRTARDHLRVLAAAGGIAESRVAEALDTVGLTEVADKRPGKFSLGMSQRLGIAAAILGQPKYLLLDEPANGLDPEGIAWLREFIKSYAALGNSVFVSSHLLAEMAQMADNIIVIGKGKLIASTSIAAMTGGKHAAVYVRIEAGDVKKFQAACKLQNYSLEESQAGWLVHAAADTKQALTTDQIGRLAFGARVPVLELSQRAASLEEAFMELTGDAEEYKAIAMAGTTDTKGAAK